MKANNTAGAVAMVAALVVAAVLIGEAEAAGVTCSPIQLSPCAAAITSGSPPSRVCCQRIQQQKPCLCGYLKNPNLKKFVDTPNARKVSLKK
ncbi:hypothetical protein V2J09_014881 [Rumex salicifolius]